ncbi:MAG: cupin domain-containing protein, partial [Candidatus Binataceae bacterium]
MPVVDNNNLPAFEIPGIRHQTIAGKDAGMRTIEVWRQTIAPGGATPVHRHACEEVIVVLKGSGRLIIEDVATDYGPDSTLIIPSDAVHQLINTGGEAMEAIACLGMAPVRVRTGDGTP